MKNLYIVGGTMGVGKTAVCQMLKKRLPAAVFLDGDWCWDSDPFQVTEETKRMVMENISFLLNQFIRCSAYENIVFCWVMHDQSIIDSIIGKLKTDGCRVTALSLVCDEAALCSRLQKDIDDQVRNSDILERSIARIPLYNELNTIKIDTTKLSISQTCDAIMGL